MVIDADGITFWRRGDRHVEKTKVSVSWTRIAEIAAEGSGDGRSFYEQLGFEG
jgi:hypothetical protein